MKIVIDGMGGDNAPMAPVEEPAWPSRNTV